MKTALITGINGQDGSYLAEFLLNKNSIPSLRISMFCGEALLYNDVYAWKKAANNTKIFNF